MDAVLPPVRFSPVSPHTLKAVTLIYIVEVSVRCYAIVVLESVWHTLRHLGLLTLWYARYVVCTPLND